MRLIDSHAHINDAAFDADRAAVINRAFDAGLSHIIEIGCEENEWQPALDLAAAYPEKIYCALGLHPIRAKDFKEDFPARLKTLLAAPAARAVGEAGLDYAYLESSPKEIQHYVFEVMLKLAAEVQKPIVLHCRKATAENDYSAYDDMFALLKNANCAGGIMHCFSGRWQDAVKALDMGFLLGVTGIVGYKRNANLRETFKKAGLKNLVVETDCPYLPPQSKRGKRNEPANIPEIAADLAAAVGETLAKTADITTQNTMRVFKLD
ncbi:MAG: TatD family hydrolase [Elusimicrobiota bacterium]|jgi:TatD DNase family protein|nr:TatD family hydrolase [Elusimicrobiota bacterium]